MRAIWLKVLMLTLTAISILVLIPWKSMRKFNEFKTNKNQIVEKYDINGNVMRHSVIEDKYNNLSSYSDFLLRSSEVQIICHTLLGVTSGLLIAIMIFYIFCYYYRDTREREDSAFTLEELVKILLDD